MTMLDIALAWARQGRPVFPVGADKRPLTKHGLHDATTDPDRIGHYWTAHPTANIAVRTGEPSGLVVLDIDGQDGADSLHDLEREHGRLPTTASVVTPRRGQHFYFAWPGVPIKTTARKIAPGIDIRGDGGYVLVPPSRTAAGIYEYDELGLRPMPAWLIELAHDDRRTPGGAAPPDAWARTFRDGIPEGERNARLTSVAGYLLRRYVAVEFTTDLVQMVNATRCRPPLPVAEVDQIINSVARSELRRRERK